MEYKISMQHTSTKRTLSNNPKINISKSTIIYIHSISIPQEKIKISRSSDLREALNRSKTLKKIPKLHTTIKPKQILESDSISIHGPRARLENAERATKW